MKRKKCNFCKKLLPVSQFNKAPTNKDGRSCKCKVCQSFYGKRLRSKQTSKDRLRLTLRKLYGITLEFYLLLLKRQQARCAICKQKCQTRQRLSVDHDHGTGKIRGLLCRNCNSGLGLFKDNHLLLRSAIQYLTEPTYLKPSELNTLITSRR